jgi:hypothetical protein
MRLKPHHALNVPGDFYVVNGCCTGCEVPFREAPGHFEMDSDGHCYVCKQPVTPADVDGMIQAVSVAEVNCIRYAGSDPVVLRKLTSIGEQDQCDMLSTENQPWEARSRGQGLLPWINQALRSLRKR